MTKRKLLMPKFIVPLLFLSLKEHRKNKTANLNDLPYATVEKSVANRVFP
jgi:hypothetical protein